MTSRKRISGRDVGLLGALVIAAWAASLLLQRSGEIGQNVGGLQTVEAVRQDQTAPSTANKLADVTLIVFSDYQCPACLLAYPDMVRATAKDGRVRIVYRDWPIFGERSERAARVALASRYQGLYVKVHHLLMSGRRVDEDYLQRTVERAGGDWDKLESDLRDHSQEIDELLARNGQQAFSMGIAGTPAYLAGPLLIRGRISEAEFSRAIAEARRIDRG